MRALFALLLAGAAVAQAPANPQSENLKQLMRSVALPNAKIIFEVQSKHSLSQQDWRDVEAAALAIQQTAGRITAPGLLLSNGQPAPVSAQDYAKYARALVPAGRDCLKAARNWSQDAVNDCTDSLSQACDNCHNVYRDRR